MKNDVINKMFTSLKNGFNTLLDKKVSDLMIKYNLNDKKIVNDLKNKANEMIDSSKKDIKKLQPSFKLHRPNPDVSWKPPCFQAPP